jgi:hypothetical protein
MSDEVVARGSSLSAAAMIVLTGDGPRFYLSRAMPALHMA